MRQNPRIASTLFSDFHEWNIWLKPASSKIWRTVPKGTQIDKFPSAFFTFLPMVRIPHKPAELSTPVRRNPKPVGYHIVQGQHCSEIQTRHYIGIKSAVTSEPLLPTFRLLRFA
jgi:hypothetical protein